MPELKIDIQSLLGSLTESDGKEILSFYRKKRLFEKQRIANQELFVQYFERKHSEPLKRRARKALEKDDTRIHRLLNTILEVAPSPLSCPVAKARHTVLKSLPMVHWLIDRKKKDAANSLLEELTSICNEYELETEKLLIQDLRGSNNNESITWSNNDFRTYTLVRKAESLINEMWLEERFLSPIPQKESSFIDTLAIESIDHTSASAEYCHYHLKSWLHLSCKDIQKALNYSKLLLTSSSANASRIPLLSQTRAQGMHAFILFLFEEHKEASLLLRKNLEQCVDLTEQPFLQELFLRNASHLSKEEISDVLKFYLTWSHPTINAQIIRAQLKILQQDARTALSIIAKIPRQHCSKRQSAIYLTEIFALLSLGDLDLAEYRYEAYNKYRYRHSISKCPVCFFLDGALQQQPQSLTGVYQHIQAKYTVHSNECLKFPFVARPLVWNYYQTLS